MDYLGKGEVLTKDRFVDNIWEKRAFCVQRKSLSSLSSVHEKWGQKLKFCIYNFVQYVSSLHKSSNGLICLNLSKYLSHVLLSSLPDYISASVTEAEPAWSSLLPLYQFPSVIKWVLSGWDKMFLFSAPQMHCIHKALKSLCVSFGNMKLILCLNQTCFLAQYHTPAHAHTHTHTNITSLPR